MRSFNLRKKHGTYGRTDVRTDGRTDRTSYRDATAHLKRQKNQSCNQSLPHERGSEQSERASERVSAAKRASESSSALSQRMAQYLRLGSCLIWPTALLGASRQKTSKNESVLQKRLLFIPQQKKRHSAIWENGSFFSHFSPLAFSGVFFEKGLKQIFLIPFSRLQKCA